MPFYILDLWSPSLWLNLIILAYINIKVYQMMCMELQVTSIHSFHEFPHPMPAISIQAQYRANAAGKTKYFPKAL